MQIKTTQTTENIIDMQIPFFRKQIEFGCTEYLAVLPDQTCVKIYTNETGGFTSLSHTPAEKNPSDLVPAYLLSRNWRICEEEDFLSFHMETLKSLSLEAVLVNAGKKDADDLPIGLFGPEI